LDYFNEVHLLFTVHEGKALAEFAQDLASVAGQRIMQYFNQLTSESIQHKGIRNLVTIADQESERYLTEQLEKYYPSHGIYAEEFTHKTTSSGYCWHIDPLDGTTNFRHHYPFFCVSLGLEFEKELVLGVIYAPYLREMFVAYRGGGAFLNGQEIRVSSEDQLIKSLLATGFSYNRNETLDNNIGNFSRMVLQVQDLRRGGSAALDLAYVACGRFEGYWEMHLSPYDVAAGTVLIREAGGLVTDLKGGNDFLYGGQILASNGKIHPFIQKQLDPFPSKGEKG
jgi:myo-inositol-1(or 4)-monophosphatase